VFENTSETDLIIDPYAITKLVIYPIKSCRGISVTTALITSKGLLHDREYMLIDPNGKFITQREFPMMAQIEVTLIDSKTLGVVAPGMPPLTIRVQNTGLAMYAQVWNDTVVVRKQQVKASAWFSKFLETSCLLVRQDSMTPRPVSAKYATIDTDQVGLADAYPVLITTEVSLQKLNEDGGMTIPMNRWRSNIILPGRFPYAEDYWGKIKIGDVVFTLAKACYRCVITTTDQETGERVSHEPLRTLAKTRRFEKGTAFGQYAIPASPYGSVKVGDTVEILKQK